MQEGNVGQPVPITERSEDSGIDGPLEGKSVAELTNAYRELILRKNELETQYQKQLKETSDYKYALEVSSIVAITDQKGIINYANDNFCKISKYSRKELIGQDHRIINSGHHPKEFIKNLWETIANGKIWKGELKNKAKDGSTYWVDATIVPFLNAVGKPYQYMAIRADITERKRVEELLLTHEELVFESGEKAKRAAELIIANDELVFQNSEKEKRAAELIIANKELLFQTEQKAKRADELILANKELAFQNEEKEKRAKELIIANKELLFQTEQKAKRAEELIIANEELVYQNEEKEKRAAELGIANKELAYQNEEKEKRAQELYLVNAELKKTELDLSILNAELEQKVKDRTEKLSLSEAFNAGVLNSLTSHIAVLDKNGNIVAVNNSWINFAKENGDVSLLSTGVGSNYLDVCKKAANEDVEEGAVVANGIQGILDEKINHFYLEYPCHSPEEQRWFGLRVVKFQSDEPMVVISHQDITERKVAEEKAKRLADLLLLATQSAKVGIWDWDIKDDILTWDEGMYRNYNIGNASEFNSIYEGWISRLHPDDKQNVQEDIDLAIANKKQYNTEFRVIWLDSTVHYIKASGIIVRDSDGNAIRMVGVNLDITDIKLAELNLIQLNANLQQQNNQLKEIAWIQSHVVRAPLARMMGIVNIIQEPNVSPAEFADWIVSFNSSAIELENVIKDITDKTYGSGL